MEMNEACGQVRELAASMLRAGFGAPAALPGLRSISLARYPASSEPYLLSCLFEQAVAPTLAQLVTAFGGARELPTDRGTARALQFGELARDARASILLIAELPAGASPADDLRVEALTLRRDLA